jgi:hypothetical protein
MFAEREGFEPPVLLQTTVFKTAALNRSAISLFVFHKYFCKYFISDCKDTNSFQN